MSSAAMRENARAMGETSCNGIVRRMVSLPRSIMGGFSRAMGHGIDRIGIGGRRHNHQHQPSMNFQWPQHPQEPLTVPEECSFLTSFEHQYGPTHPLFYACQFMEALKIAEDEHKFVFMYLHSPQHPFTPSFCRETLSSELAIQFLDANFVCWGALADRGEGLQMAATLRAASFPFCAVVAPAPVNTIAVLQQFCFLAEQIWNIMHFLLDKQSIIFELRRNHEKKRHLLYFNAFHSTLNKAMRENARAMGETSCNGIVRRMVSLPRSIMVGFSRAMGHGIDRIGIGGRRHNHQHQPSMNFHWPQHPQEPLTVPEECSFLTSFEQQYGPTHPLFYACQFMEALKIAEDEHKFVFMYLHSPQHPFTPSFCWETLSSELVIQFLDANFVCWGALADRGEGLQMAATLRAASFPFCAVVAPAPVNTIAVLQQIEGPISPAELVEILQRTVEEQGVAFGGAGARANEEERLRARAKEEEKLRADRQLREEQDAAYLEALKLDEEKEKLKHLPSGGRVQIPVQASNKANYEKFRPNTTQKQDGNAQIVPSRVRETQHREATNKEKDPQLTQILIRFPNGERREKSFLCADKIQSIYRYIDSLALPGIGNYKLVSSFPRRVYGVDQMGITLKDAGLHPRASLFLELQ